VRRAACGLIASVRPGDGEPRTFLVTPRIGLWLDTSEQTPDETVAEIVARLQDSEV
jgi:hypothetical protein